MKGFIVFAMVVLMMHIAHAFQKLPINNRFLQRFQSMMVDTSTPTSDSNPGAPVVKKIDKDTNVASMSVTIPAEKTKEAFLKACDMFNEEVKLRGYSAPGFRPGSKLPPQYLYQMFGESTVKNFCGNLLSEAIQDECELTGLMFVGRGRIMDFNPDAFKSGEPHTIDVECDLWPEINYTNGDGYKGLTVTVVKDKSDEEKVDKVKLSIRERYKVLAATPAGHAARLGDVAVVNMRGFEKNEDGSAGTPLPSVASGDQVEIFLEEGKFMPGMVESIVGGQKGDVKKVDVTFPPRPSGPGAALSGKEAVFDVEILDIKVKTLPEWNEELAGSIREGMTLVELDEEVQKAVEGDASSNTENARNEALASALLDVADVKQLPESLVEENTQSRFQQMLADFKEQGSTDEQLQEMMTPEKYEKYKELSRKNVEKIVKLGMVFRDVAEKEKIVITPEEVQEQMEGLKMQAKQKNEPMPDEARAKEEIENVLLRKKVFNMLAENAYITWEDAPDDPAAWRQGHIGNLWQRQRMQ
mmetsp:Transcript_15459/g.25754  ORF Transcript_15459/g.25754 Transcript_15459/m.25754 type:complete len:527 (+) Transcript_15459:107-1687(+)